MTQLGLFFMLTLHKAGISSVYCCHGGRDNGGGGGDQHGGGAAALGDRDPGDADRRGHAEEVPPSGDLYKGKQRGSSKHKLSFFQFECPACNRFLRPPIVICRNGEHEQTRFGTSRVAESLGNGEFDFLLF